MVRNDAQKRGGNQGTLEYNIDVLTPEQMDDMLDLVEAGAELGYTILDEVGSKEEWKAQMKEMIGESLKDATGYTDADVDELLDDLWNTPFDNDGQEKTVGEWAAEKGIVTNENENDNGTEETGNGDGVSGEEDIPGGDTVAGDSEGEMGSPEKEGVDDGRDAEPDRGAGGRPNMGDGNSGSGVRPGREEPSVATGASDGRNGGRGSKRGGGQRGGTNDRGGTGRNGGQSAIPGGTGGVGRDTSVEGAETSPAEKAKKAADLSKEKVEYKPASIGGKYAIGS